MSRSDTRSLTYPPTQVKVASTERPIPGEVFDPYMAFHAISIPLSLVCNPDLSELAKIVYGLLALHKGKPNDGIPGVCFVGVELLAKESGKSLASVERALFQLERADLIRRTRRNQEQSTAITDFLWSPILEASRRDNHPSKMRGGTSLPSLKNKAYHPSKMTGPLKDEEIPLTDSQQASLPEVTSKEAQTQSQNPSGECEVLPVPEALAVVVDVTVPVETSTPTDEDITELHRMLKAIQQDFPLGLERSTTAKIVTIARERVPGIAVSDVAEWVRRKFEGRRGLKGWGVVVRMVEQDLTPESLVPVKQQAHQGAVSVQESKRRDAEQLALDAANEALIEHLASLQAPKFRAWLLKEGQSVVLYGPREQREQLIECFGAGEPERFFHCKIERIQAKMAGIRQDQRWSAEAIIREVKAELANLMDGDARSGIAIPGPCFQGAGSHHCAA